MRGCLTDILVGIECGTLSVNMLFCFHCCFSWWSTKVVPMFSWKRTSSLILALVEQKIFSGENYFVVDLCFLLTANV